MVGTRFGGIAGLLAAAWVGLAAPRSAGAQIQFDFRSLDGGLRAPHTVGTGANRYLLVEVMVLDAAVAVQSVTFGGVALARLGSGTGSASVCRLELWGLVAPPSGTHTVAIELSGASVSLRGALSYTGVDQNDPVGPAFRSSGSGTAPALTLASAAGELVACGLCAGGAANITIVSDGPGQQPRGALYSSPYGAAQADKPGAPMVTLSWQISATGVPTWALGAVSLRPAASSPPARDAGPDAPPEGPDAAAPPDAIDAPEPDDALRTANAELAVGCACHLAPKAAPRAPIAFPALMLILLALRGARQPRCRQPPTSRRARTRA
jgi:hypothetical protein